MAGLLQFNFFPTDFYYPKPQPRTNTTVTPSPDLQTQKKNQELVAQDGGNPSLENREEPFGGWSMVVPTKTTQDSCEEVVLKATGPRTPSIRVLLRPKPNRDLVMRATTTFEVEDFGF